MEPLVSRRHAAEASRNSGGVACLDGSCRPRLLTVPLTTAEPQLRSVDAALAAGGAMAAGSAAVSFVTGFPCPVHYLTGRWCAFCGSTRAVLALIDGHPETALRDNGLLMLILAFVVGRTVLRVTGGRAIVARVDTWITHVDMRVWTALLVVWTVVRNLPWFWYLGPAR